MKINKQTIKKIVLIFSILLVSYYYLSCAKSILNQKEQFYSVKGSVNEYVDLKGKEGTSTFKVVGNDLTKIEFITNSQNIKGGMHYVLKDENNNIIYEDAVEINKHFEESENKIILDMGDSIVKKGNEYSLVLDCTDFETPISVLYSDFEIFIQQYYSFHHLALFYCILLFFFIVSIYLLLVIYNYGFNNKVFCVASLMTGVISLVIMPPASRDDEYRHFLRAYEISLGELNAELVKIPEYSYGNSAFGIPDGMGYYLSVPKKVNDIRLVDFSCNFNDKSYFSEINMTANFDMLENIYVENDIDNFATLSLCGVVGRSGIFYLPMSLMLFFGRLLRINGVFYFYLARFGQVFFCTLLGYFSLKLAPKLKNEFALLTFAPPIVLLRSSANPDGLLISLIMLYTALLFNIRENQVDLLNGKKGILSFFFLLLCACLITWMKLPYIILCLGGLLILEKESIQKITKWFKQYKSYLYVVFGLIFVTIVLAEYKNKLITTKLYGFLPKEHIEFIFNNKRYIMSLFTRKFIQQIKELYACMNTIPVISYSLVVIFAMLFSTKVFSNYKKIWFLVIFILTVFEMILVGFTLTPPDFGQIWGITYRYLLPAVIVLLLSLRCGNERTQRVVEAFVPLISIAIILSSMPFWISSWWLCI